MDFTQAGGWFIYYLFLSNSPLCFISWILQLRKPNNFKIYINIYKYMDADIAGCIMLH